MNSSETTTSAAAGKTAPGTGTRAGTRAGWLPFMAVALTVTAWASAFVAIRWVGRDYEPGPLALGRLVVASLVLGAILLLRRSWVRPNRREWCLLVVCGLAWFGAYNVALNAAELLLDAGTTAMLVNIGPVLIAVLAGALLGEGFPKWLLRGAAVALCGAVVIGLTSRQDAHADTTGVLLALVSAAAYAIGVVAQKPTLRRLPALQVTWLACLVGTISCVPYAGSLAHDVARASVGATLGLVYLGLVPTALAFTLWAYALARMNAGRLGVTTYLVPPMTIVGAAILLHESPAPLALVGGAVCLAGVALSRRRG